MAYLRAVSDFFQWCEESGLRELAALQPVHVAAYVEQLGKNFWQLSGCCSTGLVVGQVVASNPASVGLGADAVEVAD